MMMGPEPMIRIFEMSVRLGMKSLVDCQDSVMLCAMNSSTFLHGAFQGAGLQSSAASPSVPPRKCQRPSPFPLLHHLHKILEQIMRVMRPGRSLRMILHAE